VIGFLTDVLADLRAPVVNDPAANGPLDVILSYPGFHAIVAHRLIHALHGLGVPLLPRFLSSLVRSATGIEIHPAARIGKGLFIDHGMGVVIGETVEIGRGVTLYQGVTLGGTSLGHGKRHPTIGNGVVVGANASVLGAITVGEGAHVGAGSVVVRDVAPHTTVVGIPARVVNEGSKPVAAPSSSLVDMPDPTGAIIQQLAERVALLENKLAELGAPTQPARAPQVNSAIFDDVSPSI
jgi:serine O-acetyltransferase